MQLPASSVILLVAVLSQLPFSTTAWFGGSQQSSSPSRSSGSVPTSCYSPSGDDCTWYADCLEKSIPCEGGPGDYAMAYANTYCRRYQQRASSFSADGRRWVNGVRKCLQVALAPELRKSPSSSCTDIKRKAFESHVPCYLNPAGAPSLCDLPFSDWRKVFATIQGAFLDEFFSTVGGFAQVGGSCTWQKVVDAYNSITDFFR